LFQAISQKIDFSGQICEEFQFFSGNFIQNSETEYYYYYYYYYYCLWVG